MVNLAADKRVEGSQFPFYPRLSLRLKSNGFEEDKSWRCELFKYKTPVVWHSAQPRDE
jgi:hypothetical protein